MDILDLVREKPSDFNISRAKVFVFSEPDKGTPDDVPIVLCDEESCEEPFARNEILQFVKRGKMLGTVLPSTKAKDLLVLLMDAYPILMQSNPDMADRLKVANKISSLLSDLKLM